MLNSIRKFSSTIYAKILMAIIIIPFVFWGMSGNFFGGNKNIVVVISDEKYSIQDFGNFIRKYSEGKKKIKPAEIEELLSLYISEKLMEKEVENFGIKLSDKSLSRLIKHQKDFKRENKFSRMEYEKFLIKNNMLPSTFEQNLSQLEKKKQLINFINGGVVPPKFLVNSTYNKINQKRNIKLLNLSSIFDKKINFTESQINSYFEKHKEEYSEVYKSINLIELKPKNLVNSENFDDLFIKKIDEIDNVIIQGENLDYIINKFNLNKPSSYTINRFGKDLNSKIITELSKDLIKNIFNISDEDPTLVEIVDKFFIIQVSATEIVQRDIDDEKVKKEIMSNLKSETIRKQITKIITRINNQNFNLTDFEKLSKEKNVEIKKIILNNANDDKNLEKELVQQIYTFPLNKVFIVHDFGFTKNYLIYIDNIENVSVSDNSETYHKYLKLSKSKIINELYNTYDRYIKQKYEIEINYQALDTVKNYFN